MPRVYAERTAIIAARPEVIYAVIADYRDGHPHILPKPWFVGIEVEQGGIGAGTVILCTSLGGSKMRLSVSEPEPGRVLMEKDVDKDLYTTFTVTPLDGGTKASVQIRTEWEVQPGLKGAIEKTMTRLAMRFIYKKELDQLAAYVKQQPAHAH